MKYTINPKTNRRVASDYLITIFPTNEFQMEQWRINTHQKNIKNHRIDQKWKPVIKPLRDQYKTGYDYDRYVKDCGTFENAKEPLVNK